MATKPEDREAYGRELTLALDGLEQLEDERKTAMADIGARKAALLQRVKDFRDLLTGRRGVQLPLVEVPAPKREAGE